MIQAPADAAEDQPAAVDPDATLERGHCARREGRTDEALQTYRVALAAYTRTWDGLGEAHTLRALADIALEQDRFDEACAMLEQAAQVWRSAGDTDPLARALAGLGTAQRRAGRPSAARRTLGETLGLARRLEDRLLVATTLVQLGHVEADAGAWQLARSYLDRAVRILRGVGDRFGQARVLIDLGDAERAVGHRAAAQRCWTRALELSYGVGDAGLASLARSRLAGHQPGPRPLLRAVWRRLGQLKRPSAG